MSIIQRSTMMTLFVTITFLCLSCTSITYKKQIKKHRIGYKNDFQNNDHAPLKGTQLADMRFFEANKNYLVKAKVIKNDSISPFEIKTSSGKMKSYIKYADLVFFIEKEKYTLELYQNIKLMKNPIYKDYLFLPFTDNTNGESTYGGGRYLDLRLKDIEDNQILLDFNKSYNPYCAYSSGYNCPVPPIQNDLNTSVTAGEKMYTGTYIEKH